MLASFWPARMLLAVLGSLTAGAVLAGCDAGAAASNASATTSPVSSPSSSVAAPAATAAPLVQADQSEAAQASASSPAVGVSPGSARVSRVVDGDTFVIDGGQRVRVLGIDSCESGTTAGQSATGAASLVLYGTTVTLAREPGVDLDRYGRQLRYVTMGDGRDFGRYMVGFSHTAVYEGRNDGAPSYLAGLRAADPNGRTCGSETHSTTTQPAPTQSSPRTSPPRVNTTAPAPAPAPAPSSGGTYFKNCSAARAAGAAPLYRGQPGYAPKLDRDNDGIACE